jgi:hypothetical protein
MLRPNGTNRMRKERAMPTLIWIATVACIVEMQTEFQRHNLRLLEYWKDVLELHPPSAQM